MERKKVMVQVGVIILMIVVIGLLVVYPMIKSGREQIEAENIAKSIVQFYKGGEYKDDQVPEWVINQLKEEEHRLRENEDYRVRIDMDDYIQDQVEEDLDEVYRAAGYTEEEIQEMLMEDASECELITEESELGKDTTEGIEQISDTEIEIPLEILEFKRGIAEVVYNGTTMTIYRAEVPVTYSMITKAPEYDLVVKQVKEVDKGVYRLVFVSEYTKKIHEITVDLIKEEMNLIKVEF